MADTQGYWHETALIGGRPESRDFTQGRGVIPYVSGSAKIEAYVTVDAGTFRSTYIGPRTWLMKKVHVGHDAWIGSDCELAPLCSVGGHVVIGDGVRVGQGALFKPYVKVGDGARIGMGAVVICDVPAGEVWAGNPARNIHPTPVWKELWPDRETLAAGDEGVARTGPTWHARRQCPSYPGSCSFCLEARCS